MSFPLGRVPERIVQQIRDVMVLQIMKNIGEVSAPAVAWRDKQKLESNDDDDEAASHINAKSFIADFDDKAGNTTAGECVLNVSGSGAARGVAVSTAAATERESSDGIKKTANPDVIDNDNCGWLGDGEQKVQAKEGGRRECGAQEARGGSELRKEGVTKTRWHNETDLRQSGQL